MNASFLQELGFQIGWIEWLIVTRRKEMSQAEPSNTPGRPGSGPAGVDLQGLSPKGGRLKGSYFTPRQEFGCFCLGALIAALILRGKNIDIDSVNASS